jgi:hypothetical protein
VSFVGFAIFNLNVLLDQIESMFSIRIMFITWNDPYELLILLKVLQSAYHFGLIDYL